MTKGAYPSPSAVEHAIKSAAEKAAKADPSLGTSARIQQEYFRRFLSRIFFEGEDSQWMLKGGTSILARVPSARGTTDIDLHRQQSSLGDALDDLKRLASIDLGDFFTFVHTGQEKSVNNQQDKAQGFTVKFDLYIGDQKHGNLKIDLVVDVQVTDEPLVIAPANGLDLPKLRTSDYRLYPSVDQIADKVCATLATYRGKPSSREWDLVDLVVFATTEPLDGAKLRTALQFEAVVRNLNLPNSFHIPTNWGSRYKKDAKSVPSCAKYRTVELAMGLMSLFIDPILRNEVDGLTWDPALLKWV